MTSEDQANHAEALQRHAAHQSQLAEVVELHKALSNNKQQVEQTVSRSTTVSATLAPTITPSPSPAPPPLPAPGHFDEKDRTTAPTLSDLQKDVIVNLDLITDLVKQVLVLDERAKNPIE